MFTYGSLFVAIFFVRAEVQVCLTNQRLLLGPRDIKGTIENMIDSPHAFWNYLPWPMPTLYQVMSNQEFRPFCALNTDYQPHTTVKMLTLMIVKYFRYFNNCCLNWYCWHFCYSVVWTDTTIASCICHWLSCSK